MNTDIINNISKDLNISIKQVNSVLNELFILIESIHC